MAWAFDITVLQTVGPAPGLSRDVFEVRFETCNLRIQIGNVSHAVHHAEHRSRFAGRSEGNIDEVKQFFRRSAFEAFGKACC